MSLDASQLMALRAALAVEPTAAGGPAIALASAGPPPAFALLATGAVALGQDLTLRIALQRGASAAAHLGGSCSLLVADDRGGALRVAVAPARVRDAGPIALIEGPVASIRPSHEPPWSLVLRFDVDAGAGAAAAPHLVYWRAVAAWLTAGASGDGPPLPQRASG